MTWACRPWWWAVVVMLGAGWMCFLWLEQSIATSCFPRPALLTSSLTVYHSIYHNASRPTTTNTDYNHFNTTSQTVSQASTISAVTAQGTRSSGRWYQHQDPGQYPSPGHEQSIMTSDWESVMSERRARVSHVCHRHFNTLKKFTIFNRLTFDTKHHIAYCRNAKAGTTSWLRTLLEWAGVDASNMTFHQIHETITDTFPPLTSEEAAREMQVPALTFLMARHPFTRLVSAYRDKIGTNYRRSLQLEMIAKYRGEQINSSSYEDDGIIAMQNSQVRAKVIEDQRLNDVRSSDSSSYSEFTEMRNDFLPLHQELQEIQLTAPSPSTITLDPGYPTFREFVLYVSDQVMQCLPQVSSGCVEKIDIHWQPLYDRCAPCDIQYDVIAKMETFAEDERYLSQVTGLPLPPAGTSSLHSSRGPPTDHIIKTFFSTLSDSERQKVFKAFYYDFLLFGYSYDDLDFK